MNDLRRLDNVPSDGRSDAGLGRGLPVPFNNWEQAKGRTIGSFSVEEVANLFGGFVRREILASADAEPRIVVPEPLPQPLQPTAELPPLATAKEVAAFVRLTVRTLRRLVLAGKFPRPIRVGKRAIRWRAADVERWLDENRREARELRRPRT